jgi:hypothetical protein
VSKAKPISVEQLKALLGVRTGDPQHDKHSALVGACGRWLLQQPGVFVFAVDTGRFTGKGCYGTPGVPDLVGWAVQSISIEASALLPSWIRCYDAEVPRFLAVECKVGKDDLTPAQKEFRKVAEKAGVLYFVARWSGEPGDNPTADLERQWNAAASGEEDEHV